MTRRDILEEVAAGRMTPAEAAERLAALEEEGAGADGGGGSRPGVARVKLAVAGFAVRVVGDAGVREAVAEGPYMLTRDGDTMVINAEADEGRRPGHAFAFGGRWATWAWHEQWRGPRPLTVRMNPRLALAADVTAGSCAVHDVKGPLALSVSAGGLKVTGFAGPIDVDVTAGGFAASGVLNGGESRVRCSAGSARIGLERGSSVRIRGAASAGRLVLPNTRETASARRARGLWVDQEVEAVVGDGAGTLDIEVTTGNVVVRSDT